MELFPFPQIFHRQKICPSHLRVVKNILSSKYFFLPWKIEQHFSHLFHFRYLAPQLIMIASFFDQKKKK